MKKNRILSIILSLSIFATCFFCYPVYANETTDPAVPTAQQETGLSIYDVAAGLATPYDLYGEIDPATVPEAVGLETATSRVHIERLFEEEAESLNNVIFKNADGTNTMYLFDYPVKYVNEKGNISDISLEIASHPSKDGYYISAAHSLQTTFSKNSAEGINLSGDNVSITLIPLSVASNNSSGDVALQSTVDRVDNKTVTYSYDSKTSLEYSLTYRGFKEDIVVKEYTGQTEYYFTLLTGGLTLKKIGETFCLTDQFNNIRATIGDIIIFTADEKNNTFGRLTFETVKSMQEYKMTIHISESYLKDESTTYPIRIDPTIELNYSNNGSGAIHDVTLNSNYNSDTNSTALSIGRRSNTYGISRVLMKFPGLSLVSIPSAGAITEASVEIRDLLCESSALTVYCYAFTGNEWDETTVRWSNVDANNLGECMSSNTISYSNGTKQDTYHRYSFDITSAVQGWKLGNYSQKKGIVFRAADSVENGTTSNYKTIASYNRTEYRPSLSVTYTTGTAANVLDFKGQYYINNLNTGYYLYRGSGDINVSGKRGIVASSAVTDNIQSSTKWRIDRVDGAYVIRNASNVSQYLGVLELANYAGSRRITITDGAIPNSCKWDISLASGGGCIIQNKYSSKYLYSYLNNAYTGSTLGSASNYDEYTPNIWRIVRYDQIATTLTENNKTSDGLTIYRELSKDDAHFATHTRMIGDSDKVEYIGIPAYTIWVDKSDFIYSPDSSIINIDHNGNISTLNTGDTTVTVTHKPTAYTFDFKVHVCAQLTKNLGTLSYWNDYDNDVIGKWEKDTLQVYIYDHTDQNDFKALCSYAMELWEDILPINLEFTYDISSADITIYRGTEEELYNKGVRIEDDLNGIAYTWYNYAGYYTYNGNKKIGAVITKASIGILANISSKNVDYTTLNRAVITHEIGHALGYVGHSPDSSYVMYYSTEFPTFSNAEKLHIQQMYQ